MALRKRHNKARHKKRQANTPPRKRNTAHAVHIERAGAGAGFHSKRGYSRREKHRKDLPRD